MPRRLGLGCFPLLASLLVGCGTTSSTGAGQGSSCPCTIGNSGIQTTLGCGQSACTTLNGTVTGYRCESDGAHEDPSACSGDGGGGGGGSDGGPAGDGGSADAPVVPDGAVPANECESTGASGTCGSPLSCNCPSSETCSFACGAGDAGASIACMAFSSCGVACAGTCSVDCLQASACAVDVAGGSSLVNCTQAHSCTATVGTGGSVDCLQAGSCDVTCEGACTVNCSQATSCRVSCAGGTGGCNLSCGAGTTPTTCPDGKTQVCGATSC